MTIKTKTAATLSNLRAKVMRPSVDRCLNTFTKTSDKLSKVSEAFDAEVTRLEQEREVAYEAFVQAQSKLSNAIRQAENERDRAEDAIFRIGFITGQ